MATTTSTAVTKFNIAQTFFLDPGLALNSPTISLTKVGVFFKTKPSASNNRSGLYKPGVEIFLCETRLVGETEVPDTFKVIVGGQTRKNFDDIVVSNTAATETQFVFDYPILVETGKTYAIILKYDGDEQYDVWKSVEGHTLVGTNNTSAGPAGQYIGNFFQYSFVAGTPSAGGVTGGWNPLNSTDLKFNIYCAKFVPDQYANTVSTDPTTGQPTTTVVAKRSFMLYKKPFEFIMYDRVTSDGASGLIGGELVYQNNVLRSETIAVTYGNNKITSANANFAALFANNSTADRYMVIYSGSDRIVRKITDIHSNNSISVDNAVPFTNAAARFSRVVTGRVEMNTRTIVFGKSEQALILYDSSANSTLRFVNNTVESVTVSSGGTGYSNTDYILVHGWGIANTPAEVNAVANVVTNANGTITGYTLTDKGIGFLDTATYTVMNANNVASGGTSANLSIEVGATLIGERSGAVLSGCEVINLPISSAIIEAPDIENPYGTSYYFKQHYLYYATTTGVLDFVVSTRGTGYSNDDTVAVTGGGGTGAAGKIVTDSAGKIVNVIMSTPGNGYAAGANVAITTSGGTGAVLIPIIGIPRSDVNSEVNDRLVSLFERHRLEFTNTPLILSRSYEVTQSPVTITKEVGGTVNTNVSSILEMVTTSNNVYSTADILSGEVDSFYGKFAINNDYTDENTGNGRAVSKHISKVSSFGDNRLAEDIRVFVDAYRPVGSDFKVFARIHNGKDSEPFVDKDWTLLEMKTGNSVYSNPTDDLDNREYEFGFYSYPNTEFTATGSITTTSGSANLVGSNTTFSTEFANNDLVKVYSPLFPENYFISVIENVASPTVIVMKNAISNNNVVGSGFKVDKLEYDHQAFNNALNENVVRYYNDEKASFDGYNTFAIKIVFLSENQLVIPKIENIRVVGVTA